MITACVVLLYISYAIPVVCLLVRGRDSITHGPFWLGKFGLVANVVLLCWTLFTIFMYSFPYQMPATGGTMNYVSVVYVIVTAVMATDWLLRGRKSFRSAVERHTKVNEVLEAVKHGAGHARGE